MEKTMSLNADLSNVKVGDALFVESSGGLHGGMRIDYVVEITKAGNIKTEKSGIFLPNGYLRGEHGFYHTHARLATPQDKATILRMNRVRTIQRFSKWDSLSDTDAELVWNIVMKFK
jgi:hypothetical protein